MKRKKPPLWRGKQANRVRYALTATANEFLEAKRALSPEFAAAFVAGLVSASPGKNTQALPPTHEARLAGLVHTPDPSESLVPAEPAPPELWPVTQTRSSTLPPVAELVEYIRLHLQGEVGLAATSRAIRDAVPARLSAWTDDALRLLRDVGQAQCLKQQGEHVWRLR